MESRLTLAMGNGLLELPETGRILVLNANAASDLSAFDQDRLQIVQGFFPDHTTWKSRGYDVQLAPHGTFSAAIVFLPRSKAYARALIADAQHATGGGMVIVEGQKTDGIGSVATALKKRVALAGSYSKAHGKLIWFEGGAFDDWAAQDIKVANGFVTRPGVFSADAPDKGSLALLEALPDMKGKGADLGAGWGFLAHAILRSDAVTELHLVEADHTALDCARRNVTDPRAAFHWDDATSWGKGLGLNFVVMNPPFHSGRTGDPDLGRAFIAAAAKILAPSGQLWMVANRHLPYETALNALFRHVSEAGGTSGFKVLHAVRPRSKPLAMP
ncbi:MAG TPA: MFS transporter [Aliiroseovarius sp.]|nr:MFS transporter [Aliiroseovarius sp.]